MTSDTSRACNADDQAALERLELDFRRVLLRYFGRRSRDVSDIEDMVQEVFVRLMKRGGAAQLERENLSAYVFETASSVLKDRLRKQVTHRVAEHIEFDSTRHAGADFSPEHVLMAKEQLAHATAFLLELPERTRVIFVLRRLEGMRYNDIAARLGISVSAVEKHMRRALVHVARRADSE